MDVPLSPFFGPWEAVDSVRFVVTNGTFQRRLNTNILESRVEDAQAETGQDLVRLHLDLHVFIYSQFKIYYSGMDSIKKVKKNNET